VGCRTSDQGERSSRSCCCCCCCCTRSLHCAAALGSSDAVATPAAMPLHRGWRGGQATRHVCARKQAYTSSTAPRTHPCGWMWVGRDGLWMRVPAATRSRPSGLSPSPHTHYNPHQREHTHPTTAYLSTKRLWPPALPAGNQVRAFKHAHAPLYALCVAGYLPRSTSHSATSCSVWSPALVASTHVHVHAHKHFPTPPIPSCLRSAA